MRQDRTLRTPGELWEAGLVSEEAAEALAAVAARYAVAITPSLADAINAQDPGDPLARQFVPSLSELEPAAEELEDPIGDGAHAPLPGLVHRYPDRVLLKLTNICPVYCRFCFRRESVGQGGEAVLGAEAVETALAYIAGRPAIWEVILSGGDPLVLSPRRLRIIGTRLSQVEHVRILRCHTRVPVAAPQLITGTLIEALKASGKTVYIILHINHRRELSDDALSACARLSDAGIPLLSQSVLLRGVNDSPEALDSLMRALVEARIKPYYLHHADLAPGTAHFRTSVTEGRALVRALHARASGLCQPQYVLDIPGGYGKARIAEADIRSVTGEAGAQDLQLRDPYGDWHLYPPPAKEG